MSRSIFITGTDTHVGKTWVTSSLLKSCLTQGMDVQALKPIASGVEANGLNEDVACLLDSQPRKQAQDINYITYADPVAPALAARNQGKVLCLKHLLRWQSEQVAQHDITFIEGVGGLMVPLHVEANNHWLVSDWLCATADVEVMLVVELRLGCMNQTLLNCQMLKNLGQVPKWIIFNHLHGEQAFDETVETLESILCHMFDVSPQLILLEKGVGLSSALLNGLHLQSFS